jgi:hypothetical protein
MKATFSKSGGLMIVSNTNVYFGRVGVPKYEFGIFRANKWFGFSPAHGDNVGLLVAVFKIGVYFVKRANS